MGSRDVLSGRRILVVEDELLVAMESEDLLQAAGCVVVGPAPSLELAQTLIREQHPELAVLDLNLNGVSTVPLIALLRRDGIPFVIVSGYASGLRGNPNSRAHRVSTSRSIRTSSSGSSNGSCARIDAPAREREAGRKECALRYSDPQPPASSRL